MSTRVRQTRAALAALLVGATIAGNAHADWRDDMKVLRVGALTGPGADYRLATMAPFAEYLAARIGIPVEIVPAANYTELIDAQSSARIQYAIYSATSFAVAAEACQCVEALSTPVAADGALGFYSVLIARSDGPIHSLADARGKRIALAGPDSVAGHLVPMKAFQDEGINSGTYFSEVVEAADPEQAVGDLLAGRVDLAVAWSSLTGSMADGYDFGVLTRMVADGALLPASVRIVWQSRLIPFGPHAVRTDLPPELKALLSDALTAMASESPAALDAVDKLGFGGGGFATPDPGLYAVVRELVAPPAPRQ